jgi:hypothetical protein
MISHKQPRTKEVGPFPPEIKPVHVGVYRISKVVTSSSTVIHKKNKPAFRWWDGKNWGWSAATPYDAMQRSGSASHYQAVEWYGLAQARGEVKKIAKGATTL